MRIIDYIARPPGDIPENVRQKVELQWNPMWANPFGRDSDLSVAAILSAQPEVGGITFLDLGCGSEAIQGGANAPTGDLTYKNDGYFPIVPLIMQILGAKVLGIDHGDYVEGYFPFRRGDLCQYKSLDIIPDNSVDVAHAGYLFSSPTLRKLGHTSEKLRKILLPQLERIVKQNGYFLHSGLDSHLEDAFCQIVAARSGATVQQVRKVLYGANAI